MSASKKRHAVGARRRRVARQVLHSRTDLARDPSLHLPLALNPTLLLRGKVFDVSKSGNDYVLTGPRGARYRTMRNVNTPHMMFLVSGRKFTTQTMKGVWLTDKHGDLHVVSS